MASDTIAEEDLLATKLDTAHILILDKRCDEAQAILKEIKPRYLNEQGVQALLKEFADKC